MSLVTTGRPHLSQFREKKEVGNALSVATGTMSGFFLTCYFFLLIFFGGKELCLMHSILSHFLYVNHFCTCCIGCNVLTNIKTLRRKNNGMLVQL